MVLEKDPLIRPLLERWLGEAGYQVAARMGEGEAKPALVIADGPDPGLAEALARLSWSSRRASCAVSPDPWRRRAGLECAVSQQFSASRSSRPWRSRNRPTRRAIVCVTGAVPVGELPNPQHRERLASGSTRLSLLLSGGTTATLATPRAMAGFDPKRTVAFVPRNMKPRKVTYWIGATWFLCSLTGSFSCRWSHRVSRHALGR